MRTVNRHAKMERLLAQLMEKSKWILYLQKRKLTLMSWSALYNVRHTGTRTVRRGFVSTCVGERFSGLLCSLRRPA